MIKEVFKRLVGERVGRIEQEWTFDAKAGIMNAPIVASLKRGGDDKYIFVPTKDGILYALRPSGDVLWSFNSQESKDKVSDVEMMFKEDEIAWNVTSPAVDDLNDDGESEVVFGSESGLLFAVKSNASLLWRFKAGDAIRAQPVICDINGDGKQEIVFGAVDGMVYVLNNKGKLLWSLDAGSPIECKAAFEPKTGQLVVGTDSGRLISISPRGKLLWQFDTGDKITAEPVFVDLKSKGEQNILFGSFDNTLYALDVRGNPVWAYKSEGKICSAACTADVNHDSKPEVFFGSCDNNVYALNSEGSKIWSFETDFWVASSPIVLDIDRDGRLEVVAGSFDHFLYILEAEGAFMLDYMPGVSGVVQQSGSYGNVMTSEPGGFHGKKIWQLKTEGIIVGLTRLTGSKEQVLICTANGRISSVVHTN
ncbi:hypothetical protein COT48_02605 [Candidatus Woesearchaeota archaeon CG08_land_8_20_14_0_20_47_9]|nr:MAG: hypothetical protein AUJ69_03775 [Candidatus Woesearchaeota archaeon CG1_02_47_18]PIN76515.1 MAG: hypothetical protein COV22_00305 [Candidatus Woesearchaeota archaeon CG10_big_fil_rev_8_21_14_0_10_47_5]PIO04011.1 MAG: hypothetical protein COT48_02605 [Candidatus Woesearchaeota archaeon CG08_land_8_20_14_0_20_47_9]